MVQRISVRTSQYVGFRGLVPGFSTFFLHNLFFISHSHRASLPAQITSIYKQIK